MDVLNFKPQRTARPVMHLINTGRLKAHRISARAYRVSETDLKEYLASIKVDAGK
jgi:excisionase family DNA binding protein